MNFVIDASAALALAFADERTPEIEAMETRLMNGEPALTAANFHVEVLEGLLRGVREGRIEEPDALAWLNVLDSYQITTAPIWPLGNGAVWMLARQVNISAYDAGYLFLAKTRGLKLATVDGPLVNKAAKAGVTLLFKS
jgi:predicted nucleic acid-binding protein